MSSEVQIAVIDQQDTQIVLAVPGVQGATGSEIAAGGTANQVLRKASSTNYATNWSLVTNEMVDSSAAIAGTKISPNFGSQNVVTTGTSTAASFIPTSNTAPTNGLYLPAANNVAISTNGTGQLFVNSAGQVGIGTNGAQNKPLHIYSGANDSEIRLQTNSGTEQNAYLTLRNSGGNLDFYSVNGDIVLNPGNTAAAYFKASGRLGLGTSTPAAPFHLMAESSADGALIQRWGYVQADISNYYLTLKTGVSSGVVKYNFSMRNDGTDYNDVLVLDRGKVGIGVTGVQRLLHLHQNADTSIKLTNATTGTGNTDGLDITMGGGDGVTAYITNREAGATVFENNGSERARLTSDGKFLVGTSSTSSNNRLIVQSNTDSATGPATLLLAKGDNAPGSGSSLGLLRFGGSTHTHSAEIYAIRDGGTWTAGSSLPTAVVFSTTADGASSPTERMRITSAGRASVYGDTDVFRLASNQGGGTAFTLIEARNSETSTTSTSGAVAFRVYTNGDTQNTNNSYAGTSDAKLKENIVDANSQWDDLKALQVRNYNFKEGQTHRQIGLVAQEVELVSPGLVSESPDRDKDGNDLGTVTKSVRYSVLYMKAVKALQEAMERIEVLEQRLTDAGIA